MRVENTKMQNFLKNNGIKATPKFIWKGSVKGCWRLYYYEKVNGNNIYTDWYNNPRLWEKLNNLGFTDIWGKPLNKHSGNGGVFSIFTRHNTLTKEFIN